MVRDPAGLIARVPELEPLTEDARVRRAVERGDPHGLYRVLFWAHLFGRLRKHRESIRLLLSRRRLFLAPLKSAPSLFTYNGFGLTLYGSADYDGHDGTYIATHYVALLFVPVVPLRQYLVSAAESTRGGRAWTFIGKVPFSPLAFVWNRLLALLVVGSVAAGGVSAFTASRYHQVHFVNGTTVRVQAEVAGQHITLDPGRHESLSVHVGRQRVAVAAGDGTPLDSQEIEVRSGPEVEVFNVLGAGLLYREMVSYSSSRSPAGNEPAEAPAVSCGESFVRYDETTDVFVAPPKTVSMSSSTAVVHRSHIGFVSEDQPCIGYLVEHGETARAAAVARRMAEAGGYPYKLTNAAMAVTGRSEGSDAAVAFVRKALAARPDDVDTHRLYQSLAIGEGKRAELIQAYRKRHDEKPADADRAYLLARLEAPSRESPVMSDLVHRFPRHVAARRAYAFDAYQLRHFDDAVASWRILDDLDPATRPEHLEMLVRALVALRRGDEALREIESAFSAGKADRPALAELYARVAHAAGGRHDAETLFAQLADGQVSPAALAWRRARAGLASNEEAATTPQAKLLHHARAMIVAARSDPDRALALAGEAPVPALAMLDDDTWALLFAESVRRDRDSKTTQALASAGFRAAEEVRAVRVFVSTGQTGTDLEEVSFELRAAAAFARSRDSSLPAAERKRLAASARADDLLHGLITSALDGWPSGH